MPEKVFLYLKQDSKLVKVIAQFPSRGYSPILHVWKSSGGATIYTKQSVEI